MKIRTRPEEKRTTRRIVVSLLLGAAISAIAYNAWRIAVEYSDPKKSLADLPWYCLSATDTWQNRYSRAPGTFYCGGGTPLSPYTGQPEPPKFYALQCEWSLRLGQLPKFSDDWNWKTVGCGGPWGATLTTTSTSPPFPYRADHRASIMKSPLLANCSRLSWPSSMTALERKAVKIYDSCRPCPVPKAMPPVSVNGERGRVVPEGAGWV